MIVRCTVIDALTKTVITHQEENSPVNDVELHVAKVCGVDLREVNWKFETELESPKGILNYRVGDIEYKSIFLTIF